MNVTDESKLPKWAQKRLEELRFELDRLKAVEAAHAVTAGREWFTIPGPQSFGGKDVYHLWWLYPDHPHPACSLSHGDVLMVGRSRHRWGGTPTPDGLPK